MTSATKTEITAVSAAPSPAPFVPLDCTKPAFRHLKARGTGYESMHRPGIRVAAPERFDTPKKSCGGRK